MKINLRSTPEYAILSCLVLVKQIKLRDDDNEEATPWICDVLLQRPRLIMVEPTQTPNIPEEHIYVSLVN